MPHPSDILGAALSGESSGWPEAYSPGSRRPEEHNQYLRQTKAHADLLFHFAKVVVTYDTFKHQSTKDLISKYLTAGVEGFLVVAYLNGYDKWFMDCIGQNQVPPPGTEDSEQISSLSHGSAGQLAGQNTTFTPTQSNPTSTPVTPLAATLTRFTSGAMGGGKFKGWNQDGMRLYKKCVDLIGAQRRDVGLSNTFERDLLERFTGACNTPRSSNQEEDMAYDEIGTFYPTHLAGSAAEMEGGNWEPV
jgi:hypothetical protein